MIKINSIVKDYPGFHLEASMDIPRGKVTGIVGRNGSGKSTIIKGILGLVPMDGGNVEVFGKNPEKLSGQDKARLGVALAESGFSNYITVSAVVHILRNMYDSFDKEWFMAAAEKQGIPMNKAIKEFSTGMKAKVKVLAALSHQADLLILDEPTAGLDIIARNDILDMLRNYLEEDESRSILITSHISSDLEGLCDDIYMIHEGKVILHEDTDVLLGEYAVLKVTDAMHEKMDRQYILKEKKTSFGYECLTGEKQFYAENYPDMVIENGSIDDLIVMLASEEGGRR